MLPNVPVQFTAEKPELQINRGDDLASCLRRRRLELGLLQPQAAGVIGICKASIWNWENGRAEPEDSFYPNIITLLGREPWPEPRTLAERLRAQRRRGGITIRDTARVIGVSHGAVSNWEAGATVPGE